MDLYDENRNLTGEVIKRYIGFKPNVPDGRYVYGVIIFIENSYGEFLIQKTSKEKGSIYAITGGHVKSGCNSHETIINEVYEELGVDIRNMDFKLFKSCKYHRSFFDVYYLKHDFSISDLTYQEDEVEFCVWMSTNEIKDLVDSGDFRKGNIAPFNDLIKDRVKKNNLLFIKDNLDRCSIKVSDEDIDKVNKVLEGDDMDLLYQCSDEMDDIINGIIISIDNELKGLIRDSEKVTDLNARRNILNQIMNISNCIEYEDNNKGYFMGLIKEIYNNIDGDSLC